MLIALLILIPSFATRHYYFLLGGGGAASSQELADLIYQPLIIVSILVGVAITYIVFRTAIDNRSPLKTILALYVKIPTGVLFFFQLKNIFTGSSRKSRRHSVFWTIIMVPLLHGLVKDKSRGNLPSSKQPQPPE